MFGTEFVFPFCVVKRHSVRAGLHARQDRYRSIKAQARNFCLDTQTCINSKFNHSIQQKGAS